MTLGSPGAVNRCSFLQQAPLSWFKVLRAVKWISGREGREEQATPLPPLYSGSLGGYVSICEKAITLCPLIIGRESEAQCINLFLFVLSLPTPVIIGSLPSLVCRIPITDPQEQLPTQPIGGKLATMHPLGPVGTVTRVH